MGGQICSQGQVDWMKKGNYPLIAFCGMDGSGKTTFALEVAHYLENRNQPYQYIHAHSYSVSKDSFGVGRDSARRLRLLLRLGMPLALVDNMYAYLTKYRRILRERALICDRYFYDKVCRLMFYEICNESLAKSYLRLLPAPDIVYFLDLPAEVAYRRKGEYSLQEYEVFRKNYKFIADFLGARLIDTTLPLEECTHKIIEALETRRHPEGGGKHTKGKCP